MAQRQAHSGNDNGNINGKAGPAGSGAVPVSNDNGDPVDSTMDIAAMDKILDDMPRDPSPRRSAALAQSMSRPAPPRPTRADKADMVGNGHKPIVVLLRMVRKIPSPHSKRLAQITLPPEVQEVTGIRIGDQVQISAYDNGDVLVRKVDTL